MRAGKGGEREGREERRGKRREAPEEEEAASRESSAPLAPRVPPLPVRRLQHHPRPSRCRRLDNGRPAVPLLGGFFLSFKSLEKIEK